MYLEFGNFISNFTNLCKKLLLFSVSLIYTSMESVLTHENDEL